MINMNYNMCGNAGNVDCMILDNIPEVGMPADTTAGIDAFSIMDNENDADAYVNFNLDDFTANIAIQLPAVFVYMVAVYDPGGEGNIVFCENDIVMGPIYDSTDPLTILLHMPIE